MSKGLATVIRYRQGDDQRSSCYDDLLKAEDRAEKKAVGVHSKKDSPLIRVADISGVSHQVYALCCNHHFFAISTVFLQCSTGLVEHQVDCQAYIPLQQFPARGFQGDHC